MSDQEQELESTPAEVWRVIASGKTPDSDREVSASAETFTIEFPRFLKREVEAGGGLEKLPKVGRRMTFDFKGVTSNEVALFALRAVVIRFQQEARVSGACERHQLMSKKESDKFYLVKTLSIKSPRRPQVTVWDCSLEQLIALGMSANEATQAKALPESLQRKVKI